MFENLNIDRTKNDINCKEQKLHLNMTTTYRFVCLIDILITFKHELKYFEKDNVSSIAGDLILRNKFNRIICVDTCRINR